MNSRAEKIVEWIRDYFKDNPTGKAIIGISGGKDSTICASLLVNALGADRVIGVVMPQYRQDDIIDSYKVCEYLNIHRFEINIGSICEELCYKIDVEYDYDHKCIDNPMIKTNLPARIRMATLYSVAALYPNSRVVNTSNYSEKYIGYSTKWGDGVGDFSPLGSLTVREVLEVGDSLGLPMELVHKTPADGMSGKTDEEKLGFTYDELDSYLLNDTTSYPKDETIAKINKMNEINKHKMNPIPTYREV